MHVSSMNISNKYRKYLAKFKIKYCIEERKKGGIRKINDYFVENGRILWEVEIYEC